MPAHPSLNVTGRRGVLALLPWGAAAILLPGCAGYYYGDEQGPGFAHLARKSLLQSSEAAAERLLDSARLAPDTPVAVHALRRADSAPDSSPFGRVVARQIASALARSGVALAPDPTPADAGDSVQALDAAMQARHAPVALVGNYTVAARQVYLSLRLVHAGQAVLAALDYAVPIDGDVRALLRT